MEDLNAKLSQLAKREQKIMFVALQLKKNDDITPEEQKMIKGTIL